MIAVAFLAYLVLCLFIAERAGSKRRIGKLWSLFFLCVYGFIPGLIAVYESPRLNRMPAYTGKFKVFNLVIGSICLILAALQIVTYISATKEPTYSLYRREDTEFYKFIFIILFLGTGIYFLRRDSRNRKLYEEKQLEALPLNNQEIASEVEEGTVSI